jgi:hypothetical protein
MPTAGAAPFASITGSCDSNADRPQLVSSPPLASDHADVIAQVQTHGAGGEVTTPGGISVAFGGGDTAWADLGRALAGGTASLSVICRTGAAGYAVSFADAPTPPVNFTGVSRRVQNVSLAASRLSFEVPVAGHYVAEVSVSGGPIEVGLRRGDGATPTAVTFTGPGSLDLGALQAGEASLDVTPLGAAPSDWTLSVVPATG